MNKLEIIVLTKNIFTPACLIFAITQEDKSCYNCIDPNSFYNKTTCQCQKKCDIVCIGTKVVDPVTCSCVCPVIACIATKVVDPVTCSCVCPLGIKCLPD